VYAKILISTNKNAFAFLQWQRADVAYFLCDFIQKNRGKYNFPCEIDEKGV
jgi:hypothetical protein